MPNSVLVYGDLKAQKLRIDNLPALTQWIATQPDGARFRAQFERTDLPKRERLEKFYRYVLLPRFGDHAGNDPHVQHDALWQYLRAHLGYSGSVVRDLAALTDDDLSAYVQDSVRVAAEMGCVIRERP